MGNLYRVAVHYGEDNGYVEYDGNGKSVRVVLQDPNIRQKAEAYFANELMIAVPQDGLRDFKEQVVHPTASKEEFQLAMTRLWMTIGVHVDWSRPVPAEAE